jgi:hypothetical protein
MVVAPEDSVRAVLLSLLVSGCLADDWTERDGAAQGREIRTIPAIGALIEAAERIGDESYVSASGVGPVTGGLQLLGRGQDYWSPTASAIALRRGEAAANALDVLCNVDAQYAYRNAVPGVPSGGSVELANGLFEDAVRVAGHEINCVHPLGNDRSQLWRTTPEERLWAFGDYLRVAIEDASPWQEIFAVRFVHPLRERSHVEQELTPTQLRARDRADAMVALLNEAQRLRAELYPDEGTWAFAVGTAPSCEVVRVHAWRQSDPRAALACTFGVMTSQP